MIIYYRSPSDSWYGRFLQVPSRPVVAPRFLTVAGNRGAALAIRPVGGMVFGMTKKLATPTTQVWFRNPRNYMSEVIEAGAMHVAWDFGTLVKWKIDPEKFASMHYGAGQEWRGLVVANEGAKEIGPGRGQKNPIAVYPVWSFTEDISILEDLIESPVSEDPEMLNDPNLEPWDRPIAGQPHMVVVCDLPPITNTIARKFLHNLRLLQEMNPECTIHIHGIYGLKTIFSLGFKSTDWEARTDGSQGYVILPNGKKIKEDRSALHSQWITLLGMRPAELKEARNRCIYNIRSAMWGGENFLRAVKFRTTGKDNPDTESPTALMELQEVNHYAAGLKGKPGDKFICATCSLADKCKFYREGSICTLPKAESNDLAKMFGSRDADMIIDALGALVKANSRRLQMGIENEQEEDELDPKISSLLDDIFKQGTNLAKLVDPQRFAPGKVKVDFTDNRTQIMAGNPSQMIASVVRDLELQGFERHEITKDMIAGVLASLTNGGPARAAIEGTVVDQKSE